MYDSCKNSTQPEANAVSAYNAWTSAGFPAKKLVLGLPSYGYISKSNATNLRTRSRLFAAAKITSTGAADVEVVGEGGTIQFRDIISQGALVLAQPANVSHPAVYDGAGGFEKHWDSCSSTPYLRSANAGQIIAYDDPESLHMKAKFALKVGMLGTNMFDVHGDSDGWDLTTAVRNGMGLA